LKLSTTLGMSKVNLASSSSGSTNYLVLPILSCSSYSSVTAVLLLLVNHSCDPGDVANRMGELLPVVISRKLIAWGS